MSVNFDKSIKPIHVKIQKPLFIFPLFFYHGEHGEAQGGMNGKKPLFQFVPLCLSVSSVVYFFYTESTGKHREK